MREGHLIDKDTSFFILFKVVDKGTVVIVNLVDILTVSLRV